MKRQYSVSENKFIQRMALYTFAIIAVLCSIQNAAAKNDNEALLVTDGSVFARFSEQKTKGSVSLAMAINASNETVQKVLVKDLNIALFDVMQYQLSGVSSENSETGSVGFTITNNQYLTLDLSKNIIVGELAGWIDYEQQAELNPPQIPEEGAEFIPPPRQRASLYFEMQLAESIQLLEQRDDVSKVYSELFIKLVAKEDKKNNYREFKINITSSSITTEWGHAEYFELGKNLCIQPVRVIAESRASPILGKHKGYLFKESGKGLKFGMPAAVKQWAKVDVVFNVRDWITVRNRNYVIADPQEQFDLMSEVDQSDCIEVFFTHKFYPEDIYGGGFTFVGGTSSAKIVSSDDNDNGVDFHHLAHELGHVLSLLHPGPESVAQFPSQKEASTGTLMCSSGFLKDNPAINSVENGNNLSNPLLRFTIKRIDQAPDCADSQDCGECPSF